MCLSGRVRPAIGAIQRVGPNCAPRCALESLKSRSVRPSKRLKPPSRYQWRVKGLKSLQRREGATRGNRPCKRSGGSVSRRPTRGRAAACHAGLHAVWHLVCRVVCHALCHAAAVLAALTPCPAGLTSPGGRNVSKYVADLPARAVSLSGRAARPEPTPRSGWGTTHTLCTLSVNRVVGTKC